MLSYLTSSANGQLSRKHQQMLEHESVIDPGICKERGYYTARQRSEVPEAFSSYQRRLGLVIPINSPDGESTSYQLRPDKPRRDKKGKIIKYETAGGSLSILDVHPKMAEDVRCGDGDLWITEGIKKADSLTSRGLCTVGLIGVWNWQRKGEMLPGWDHVALEGRRVYVVFDSDVMDKPEVQVALERLVTALEGRGADVLVCYLPTGSGQDEDKVGVDDFLSAGCTVEELVGLARKFEPSEFGKIIDQAIPQVQEKPRTAKSTLVAVPGSPEKSTQGYNLTDLGNSERFIGDHGKNVRYCYPWGKWLLWTGARWALDENGQVHQLAKRTVRGIYEEAAKAENDERRKELAKHAAKSEAESRIQSMLGLAKSDVPISPRELDADPWLLGVPNGTIDLRTGELRDHRREDLITKLSPVEYHPEARAESWELFLERVLPSEGLRKFVQRLAGYVLTGDVSEQILPFLHGSGANGKTTFFNALLEVAGDYGQQAAPDLLLAKRGSHPTELADLFGARLVTSVEVEDGRRMAEGLVKQLTGGDRIKARRMREDFWEFSPTHKVLLGANHKPEVRGTDHAIWRRIKLIPFDVTIPKSEQDPKLSEKLSAELPGILAWAVRGCLEWQRNGLGEPEEVTAATEGYRVEMDVLAAFIEERCAVHPHAETPATPLYQNYVEWCEETGEKEETQRAFGTRLGERGFTRKKRGGIFHWFGIGLRHNDHTGPPEGLAGPTRDKGPGDKNTGFAGKKEDSEKRPGPSGPKNDIDTNKSFHEAVMSKKGPKGPKGPDGNLSSMERRALWALRKEGRGPAKNLSHYLAGDTTLEVLTRSVLFDLRILDSQLEEGEFDRWAEAVRVAADLVTGELRSEIERSPA